MVLLLLLACSENTLEKVADPVEEGVRELVVEPDAVDFGVVLDNATTTRTLTLTASGTAPVTVDGVSVLGSGAFTVTALGGDLTLDPGTSAELLVTYTPASAADTATVYVTSDAATPELRVPLTGAGAWPAILVEPGSMSFESAKGEAVSGEVVVTSVGTADLVLSTMLLTGEEFDAEAATPATLAPGETLTVPVTYRPSAPEQVVTGELWFATNTLSGYAVVPLQGQSGRVCMGLGEAWDRGLASVRSNSTASTLLVENLAADEELCIDQWYVYLAEGSQDAGAGDPSYDLSGAYPLGSITIDPGAYGVFGYANDDGGAWWCVEQAQMMDGNQPYEFTGGHVPDVVLASMLDGNQDAVWSWQETEPLVVAGRYTNFVDVATDGSAPEVTLRVFNMGEAAAEVTVEETVPAGFTGSGFSQAPDATVTNSDGSTTWIFEVTLEGREAGGTYTHSTYDEVAITYTLGLGGCRGEVIFPELAAGWRDTAGGGHVSTANPLVVHCP